MPRKKTITLLHRATGKLREFTEAEWESAQASYKARNKSAWSYYAEIDPKPEPEQEVKKPEKATEPIKNTKTE